MFYRPIDTTDATPEPTTTRHGVWAAIAAIFASLRKQHLDAQYLDGMRPEELEDLGLRRTEGRDYDFFR
jgi:hypothetical protein